MTYPTTIQIKSDSNILTLKKLKKDSAVYVYTDSISKIGVELEINELQLNKMINMEVIKIS